jgi:site-specific recombinase
LDLIIEALLLFISTILLILSVASLVAVYRNFKFSDSTLIFSTVLITASIVFLTLYFSINVYEAALKEVQKIDIIANSVDYLKVTCLLCAFLLDLYKWLIFIIASRDLNDNDETDMNS